MTPGRTRLRRPAATLLASLLVAGCAAGPILANPVPARPVVTPAPTSTPAPPDPQPIILPRDDAPHRRLTEWWYYTGHLRDEAGRRWGFEYVMFRAERGAFPVSWASHLALTDETGGVFRYAQRSEVGPQVDVGGTTTGSPGFDLAITGSDPTADAPAAREPWTMGGSDGIDRLRAAATVDEVAGPGAPAGFALDLDARATKPPVLHNGIGWIDFGPAGGSYYYSRTAMAVTGSLEVSGRASSVDGSAWFDHQWGDFIAVGGGGWDWFAVNLDDGTDLTLSLVRDADGSYPLVYGTLVEPDGEARHLEPDQFTVTVTGRWRSPRTGAGYPAGWTIAVPGERLEIRLAPTVADQELDTRATTGVVYWEGSQQVRATRAGQPLGGEAYVELTGYAPATAGAATP